MYGLRLSVTLPLSCVLACTSIGDRGDLDEFAEPQGDATAARSRRPIQGENVPSELSVDDGARCSDQAAADEVAPVDPLALPSGVENRADGKDQLHGGLGLVGTGRGGGSDHGTIGAGFGGRGTRVPTVRQGKAEITGSYDKDQISRVIRAHMKEVRLCYRRGLALNPNLKGRVSIKFMIDGKGKIPGAVVEKSTLTDPRVGDCIAEHMLTWTFRAPICGTSIVVYPFMFEPG